MAGTTTRRIRAKIGELVRAKGAPPVAPSSDQLEICEAEMAVLNLSQSMRMLMGLVDKPSVMLHLMYRQELWELKARFEKSKERKSLASLREFLDSEIEAIAAELGKGSPALAPKPRAKRGRTRP